MFLRWGAATKWVRCLDGTTRLVYLRIDDAIPLYVKDSSIRADAAVKALEQISVSATLNADQRLAVNGFLHQVDRANGSLQAKIRATYLAYTTDPCRNSEWILSAMQEVMREESGHRARILSVGQELLDRIQSGSATSEAVAAIQSRLRAVEREISGETNLREVADAFEVAKNAATAWRRAD